MEFMHRFKLWCKEKYLFENIFRLQKAHFSSSFIHEILSSLPLLGDNIWTDI